MTKTLDGGVGDLTRTDQPTLTDHLAGAAPARRMIDDREQLRSPVDSSRSGEGPRGLWHAGTTAIDISDRPSRRINGQSGWAHPARNGEEKEMFWEDGRQ